MKKKIAVITGGSSGIGLFLVEKYCKEGYFVYSTYKTSRESALKLMKKYKNNLNFSQVDLSNTNTITSFFDHIKSESNYIDCLINNAGVVLPSTFDDLSIDSWINTFSINLFAPFLCTKNAKILLERSSCASIVNISSMRGLESCGGVDVIDYSSSKAALINMSQTLAKEFKSITVNCIAPGFVSTENSIRLPEPLRSAAISNSSIRRFVKCEEVADLCYFLTSDKARAITGTVVTVDGGYSLIKP